MSPWDLRNSASTNELITQSKLCNDRRDVETSKRGSLNRLFELYYGSNLWLFFFFFLCLFLFFFPEYTNYFRLNNSLETIWNSATIRKFRVKNISFLRFNLTNLSFFWIASIVIRVIFFIKKYILILGCVLQNVQM